MKIWGKVLVAGAISTVIALVLLVVGFSIRDTNVPLYLSIAASLIAGSLLLLGVVGTIVNQTRDKPSGTSP
jgi:zinc transporter ZupT